jgi:two-component system, OmpR family, response regulator
MTQASPGPPLLLVEDEESIGALVRAYLEQTGYRITWVRSGEEALAHVQQLRPRLVILDVGLPGQDGFDVCRSIRARSDVPIVMLTARDEEADRVAGLEVGADDYVAKPFDPRELRARLKSVLRRLEARAAPEKKPAKERVAIGACTLDLRSRELRDAQGREVPITAMEFSLLKTFLDHPNQVLSRDRLLTLTRNREWEPFDRSIDIRIARLRRKIEADPDRPRSIKTVRGAGYMFVPGER